MQSTLSSSSQSTTSTILPNFVKINFSSNSSSNEFELKFNGYSLSEFASLQVSSLVEYFQIEPSLNSKELIEIIKFNLVERAIQLYGTNSSAIKLMLCQCFDCGHFVFDEVCSCTICTSGAPDWLNSFYDFCREKGNMSMFYQIKFALCLTSFNEIPLNNKAHIGCSRNNNVFRFAEKHAHLLFLKDELSEYDSYTRTSIQNNTYVITQHKLCIPLYTTNEMWSNSFDINQRKYLIKDQRYDEKLLELENTIKILLCKSIKPDQVNDGIVQEGIVDHAIDKSAQVQDEIVQVLDVVEGVQIDDTVVDVNVEGAGVVNNETGALINDVVHVEVAEVQIQNEVDIILVHNDALVNVQGVGMVDNVVVGHTQENNQKSTALPQVKPPKPSIQRSPDEFESLYKSYTPIGENYINLIKQLKEKQQNPYSQLRESKRSDYTPPPGKTSFYSPNPPDYSGKKK